MGRKKVQLHALVLPESKEKLNVMVKNADRSYIGTKHSIGGIIDVLVNDVMPPVDRQREKVKDIAKQLHLEKGILEDMEEAKDAEQLDEKSKEIIKKEGSACPLGQ